MIYSIKKSLRTNTFCYGYSKMAAYVRRVQNKFNLFLFIYICCIIPVTISFGVGRDNGQNQNLQPNVGIGGAEQNRPLHLPGGNPPGQQGGLDTAGRGLRDSLQQKLGNPPENRQRADAGKNVLLANHPDCQDDVARLCDTKNLRKNNFAVLECLQADEDVQV